MRLAAFNCLFLACTAAVMAEERPRRHLHQIKEMIVNKLFSSSAPDCTKPATQAPALETQFFRIPGFNDVVIKAVPKGSGPVPAPIYEKLPPNSKIGLVGSYLGTSTLNDTYNALLGVKNLLTSGILSGKPEVLQEVGLVPSKVQVIAKPVRPCGAPGLRPLPLEPVRVLVKPPMVPVVPTQYSYKQVNQDGSLTTYTSSLDLGNGVRVTEDGKTLPFIIDRVRKIPVRLPVPVLPEISKIVVSEVPHPATYSYQQIHQDGRLTSYMGLPPLISQPGPVIVTEAVARLPPPPVFLMDRIEKVATIASYPKVPFVAPKPVAMNAAVAGGNPVPVPGPTGYSYSQMNINGGMTTHSAYGEKSSVVVTETGLPTAPINVPSLPEKNPFEMPAGYGAYSYVQVHGDGKTSFNGLGVPGPVNVVEHKPISVSPGIPIPPNSFSYKQIGDGKMITYTGSGIYEESYGGRPAVLVHGMPHPIPPPHITNRIEMVAAGAKFNRPPYSMPIAVPVPTGFVSVPPVHAVYPQRPVKIPTTPGVNSFVYKHVHSDGSVTNYGSDSLTVKEGKAQVPPPADMTMPFPQGKVGVFESPMYSGPFPMNPMNPNAVKPSTPVSGSYSYKLVNSGVQASHPPAIPIDGPIVDTFAPPPPNSIPAPIHGCVEPEISNPAVHIDNPETLVPLTYSYKQISHNNPNPFLVVNVEDPVRGEKNVNSRVGQNSQDFQSLPPLGPPPNMFPVNVVEQSSLVQPAPFVSAPIPVPQVPTETSPSSSFSYKQVTSQANQPLSPRPQPVHHTPTAFVPHQKSDMPEIQVPEEMVTPSSFSYQQVTSQTFQHTAPPQLTINGIEHIASGPSVPPPMISSRTPQMQKDSAPSSFSYKQVTNEGVYEYADQFPTGLKTNLSPNTMNQGNPSGNVYVEQKPQSNPEPVPSSPMPIPSRPKPTINRQDSLANNPIIVPDSTPSSSFSFKSSNPDGSRITVKNDGHNSIAVQVEESPKAETVSQDPTMVPATADIPRTAPVVPESVTTSAPEETLSPVSGHARPMRRRVVKRVKSVKHRGDIPDSDTE